MNRRRPGKSPACFAALCLCLALAEACAVDVDQPEPEGALLTYRDLDGVERSARLLSATGNAARRQYVIETEDALLELTAVVASTSARIAARDDGHDRPFLEVQLSNDFVAIANADGQSVVTKDSHLELTPVDRAVFRSELTTVLSEDLWTKLPPPSSPIDAGDVQASTAPLFSLGGGGGLSAMCCEKYDPKTDRGSDCAFLGPGRTCQGDIMTCPGGCEYIDSRGNGICRPCSSSSLGSTSYTVSFATMKVTY